MISRGLKPDIYQYNLLIRCIKDCGIGQLDDVTSLLQPAPTVEYRKLKPGKKMREKSSKLSGMEAETSSDLVVPPSIPDVLSPVPRMDNLVSIASITTPHDRLALVGGLPGLLQRMRAHDVRPDIKTFSQLVDVVESSEQAEDALMAAMGAAGVIPDITFCNLLMRKRIFRQEYDKARVCFLYPYYQRFNLIIPMSA